MFFKKRNYCSKEFSPEIWRKKVMRPLLSLIANAKHPQAAVLMTKDESFLFLWQVFLREVMIYVLAENTVP